MKKKKGYVAALLCAAVLAGCGSPAGGGGSGGGLFSKLEKEPEMVTDFTIDDIAGSWYGVSDTGTVYMMAVERESDAPEGGSSGTFRIGIMQDEIFNAQGSVDICPVLEWTEDGKILIEDGRPVEKRDERGNIVNNFGGFSSETQGYISGELYDLIYVEGNPYDDGSLHVRFNLIDNDEKVNRPENVVFTHEFSLPAVKADREEGTLSGIWYVYHDEEEILLVAYPEGTFYIQQENVPVFGDYRLEGDTVFFTCRMADGEPYKGGDAVVSMTLRGDNSFDLGETVMPPVTGKHSGCWTCDPEEGTGSGGPVYQLELSDNGGFILRQIYNEKIREAVGVCLYRSDTEAELLYFFSNGETYFKVRESITIEPDGEITMNYRSRVSHFRKD